MESKVYLVRFWNKANECIRVGGKYWHEFDSEEEAMQGANALLRAAVRAGAVEADIDNKFYAIEDD